MVATAGAVVGGDPHEIPNILSEHAKSAGDGRAENLCIGSATKTKIRDSRRFDPARSEGFGHRGWVHLVDENLHRASAAAVSARWRSILARISSGYAARYASTASI